MATEVLLMQTIPNLGEEGAVVKVADGYARNYLFRANLAQPVTDAARRGLEKLRKEREAVRKATLSDAQRRGAALKDASVTLRAKTSDGETLYGSVTAGDIADAVTALGTAVDRAMVQLEHPIKALGSYDVVLKIHQDVSATVKVWIVQE
jgi:large subunit ribosomal protein L9